MSPGPILEYKDSSPLPGSSTSVPNRGPCEIDIAPKQSAVLDIITLSICIVLSPVINHWTQQSRSKLVRNVGAYVRERYTCRSADSPTRLDDGVPEWPLSVDADWCVVKPSRWLQIKAYVGLHRVFNEVQSIRNNTDDKAVNCKSWIFKCLRYSSVMHRFALEMPGNGFLHSHSLPFPCNRFPFLPIPIPNFVTNSHSHAILVRLFPFLPIPIPEHYIDAA